MKLLGKLILVVTALLFITSITLWILAKNINPETVKKLVNNKISALTHKKSHVDGAISWQLLPRPGLKFNKIVIGDEPTSDEYSLSIDTMLLNLKITPLLRGNFVFSEVDIDGLRTTINLDLAQAPKSTETPSPSSSKQTNYGEQFAIERLLVNHGQIAINKNSHSTVFKNVQIGMDQFNLQNAPFTVQVKAKLSEFSSNPLIRANINFKGRLSLTPELLSQFPNSINQSTAEGQLLLQNVLLNQFAIKKTSATIKTNKQGIQLNPLTLSLYDGESIGSMDYTYANKQLSLNQTATNLNGKLIMTTLLGHDMVSGNLDYSVHAIIPIEQTSINTISGKGSIAIKNGEFYNINLEQLLDSLKNKLTNLMPDKTFTLAKVQQQLTDWDSNKFNQGNTPFKLASMQYQFNNGVLSSDTILLQTDKLQVKGQGSLNLATNELNSKLQASTNNTDSSMQKIQQILGGYFPLVVSGTLNQPKILPDFKQITPLLGSLIKTSIQKPVNEIRDRLRGLLR